MMEAAWSGQPLLGQVEPVPDGGAVRRRPAFAATFAVVLEIFPEFCR
jgi:hypothetical protein